MTIRVTKEPRFDRDEWRRQLAGRLDGPMREVLSALKIRTDSGMGFNDGPLASYSEGYEEQLRRRGESTQVDMRRTGQMMDSLQSRVEIDNQGVTGIIYSIPGRVGDSSGSFITNPDLIHIHSETRDFFGLSESDVTTIIKRLTE